MADRNRLNDYEHIVSAREIPTDQLPEIVQLLLDRFGLDIIEERTPDYTTYELRER